MNCAMMQPAFLPWQGFFDLILQADRFVFLDDFQFSIQSYQQRNRLFLNQGQVGWYTVPVQKSSSYLAPLNRTAFAAEPMWRAKMWRRIQANYGKAPFFAMLAPWLEAWLVGQYPSLASQNIAFIRGVCDLLHINPEFRLSSELPSELARSWRVLDLVRWCCADRYLSARGSFGYMLSDGVFPVEGITVLFQDFNSRPYPQVGLPGSFAPYLSTLDALLNVGPEATLDLIRQGTVKWSTWEEMLLENPAIEVQAGEDA